MLALPRCSGWIFGLFAASVLQAEPAKALVDDVLENPGHFQQACSVEAMFDNEVPPVPVYEVRRSEQRITRENFGRLRARRAEVVAELRRRLREADPAQLGSRAPWADSNVMMMLIDLNAVEALPELVAGEASLHGLAAEIALAPGQRKAPEKWAQQFAHTEVLAVIATLLRQERFRPVLESKMERTYRAELAKEAKRFEGKRRLEDIAPADQPYVLFDPISGEPRSVFTKFRMPYSEELRAAIVGWAEEFVKAVPPGERKADEGMLIPPVTR